MSRLNPRAPVGVQVHNEVTRESLPVECVYVGWEQGHHIWRVATPFNTDVYTTVSFTDLPPGTALQFVNKYGDEVRFSVYRGGH